MLFKQEIENIYAEGGYCFIEFGPRNVLTNLVKDILSDRPHLAVALNTNSSQDSDRTLRTAIVQLRVAGLPLQNIDPYQPEPKIPEVTTNKVLNIRLDSTNYVSEKTKQSFAKALQNGHQVKLTPTPSVEYPFETQQKPAANGKVKSVDNGQSNKLDIQPPQPNPELALSQRVIDSLEYTLIEFNRHQRDILQVHEQSLEHQTEYTKTFFQLMQQQHLLWGNHKFTEQQAQKQQIALSSSERNIMRFHDHQAETLRIHEQYLNYQHDYTHDFFQLLQQQYDQLLSGNTNQDSLIPLHNDQDIPEAPLPQEDNLVQVTTPAATVTNNEFVSKSEPTSSNGNGVNHQAKSVLDLVTPQESKIKIATLGSCYASGK